MPFFLNDGGNSTGAITPSGRYGCWLLLLHPDILRASDLTASLARVSVAARQQSPLLMRNRGRCWGGGSTASGIAGCRDSFEFCRCRLPLLGINRIGSDARNDILVDDGRGDYKLQAEWE
jgi:hypothetical protein